MMRWPAALVCVLAATSCLLDRNGHEPSAGGGGAGASGGSGGGPIPVEHECLDGTDDDGDGEADCDDSDCAGIATCLDYVPDVDYVLLVPAGQGCAEGDTTLPVKTCTRPKSFLGGGGCQCVENPGNCTVGVDVWDAVCGQIESSDTVATCYTPNPSGDYGIAVRATHDGDASCTTSAPTANTADMTLCLPVAQSCHDHPSCVRAAKPDETWCFLTNTGCTSPFNDVALVYDGSGGSCTCACEGPTVTNCHMPQVTIDHGTDDCSGSATTSIPADGGCHQVTDVFSFLVGESDAEKPHCIVNDSLDNAPQPRTLCCLVPPS